MLLTNNCTWLEEVHDRRYDVHRDISRDDACFNACSERGKINSSKCLCGNFLIVDYYSINKISDREC